MVEGAQLISWVAYPRKHEVARLTIRADDVLGPVGGVVVNVCSWVVSLEELEELVSTPIAPGLESPCVVDLVPVATKNPLDKIAIDRTAGGLADVDEGEAVEHGPAPAYQPPAAPGGAGRLTWAASEVGS